MKTGQNLRLRSTGGAADFFLRRSCPPPLAAGKAAFYHFTGGARRECILPAGLLSKGPRRPYQQVVDRPHPQREPRPGPNGSHPPPAAVSMIIGTGCRRGRDGEFAPLG